MTECAFCARACFFVFISSAVHTFDCEFSIRFDAESEYFHIRANSGKAYDLNAFEHTQTHPSDGRDNRSSGSSTCGSIRCQALANSTREVYMAILSAYILFALCFISTIVMSQA